MPGKTFHKSSRAAFVVILFFCLATPSFARFTVENLKCEDELNPLGVDAAKPRLSWQCQSDQRGDRQTAYQIMVASGQSALKKDSGDLWDSGKVASEETIQIPYAGKPLSSSEQVFWKVRSWDADGKVSQWSPAATWTMGLLAESDWKAKWIAAPTNVQSILLRREFTVKRGLRRAVVRVCGLGQYEFSANGKKVGDALLAPGWSQYNKTCLYDTLDLTSLLHRGQNAVGIILGNGMYHIAADKPRYVKFTQSFGPLRVIAQIQLDYEDGTSEVIGTDASWQTGRSPVAFNNVYGGEDYDARLEQKGWDAPEFKATQWQPAVVTEGPGGKLRGQSAAAPPIRAFDAFQPVTTRELRPGLMVYDLGQNASMMIRLRVAGPAGSFVRVIPSELLKPDGTVDRTSATEQGVRPAWWQYTLKGEGTENYFPKFFYQGCRYLQVEIHPAKNGGPLPKIKQIKGVVVHSSSKPIGEFTCSNTLFNRIYQLVRWAQRSNMQSLMTDCPARERLGWLEQDHLNGPALRYNFDLAQLFRKSMNDMADSQLENGFVPNIAPEYFVAGSRDLKNGMRNSPEWGGSFIMVPWQQYQFTGDTGLLRTHYDAMKRYVAFLGSTATDHIVPTGLGDWCDIGPKPSWGSQLTTPQFTATAFYQHYVWVLARAAEVLGKPDEAKQFGEQAEAIRAAINEKFYHPETHQYEGGSQTANSLAVVMNLVEATNRAAVIDNIIADVRAKGLTSGEIGYAYLLRALAESGHSDVIYAMNNQSDKPGYGYQLKMGATALTEKWDTSINGGYGSQNHFMLGQINEWFFHDLAGIQPAAPGFKHIIIKPAIVGDLTWVKGKYDSVRGPIITEWDRDKSLLTLRLTIPPDTMATVFLPAKSADDVREGAVIAAKSPGVSYLRMDEGCAVFTVGSGSYTFVSRL